MNIIIIIIIFISQLHIK